MTKETECKCKLAQKLTGDGCKWCNPQMQFDIYEQENDKLEKQNKLMREVILSCISMARTNYSTNRQDACNIMCASIKTDCELTLKQVEREV